MLQLKFEKILKIRGLSVTNNRLKLLKVFVQLDKPLDLKSIKLLMGSIDRVSLFRILLIFEKTKIIHSINLAEGSKLYALCDQECASNDRVHEHKHIHFQCTDCDDVSCLPITNFPILTAPNYIINNVSINASGLCSECKNI